MSREYMILIVDKPTEHTIDVDDLPAKVFMRFTEEPSPSFLQRLAKQHLDKRIYCLMGASTWHEADV